MANTRTLIMSVSEPKKKETISSNGASLVKFLMYVYTSVARESTNGPLNIESELPMRKPGQTTKTEPPPTQEH